jgi:Zn-dependent protease with chaperone function
MPRVEFPGRSVRMRPLWARVDANRTKLATFVVLFMLGSAVLLVAALVVVPGSLLSILFADTPSGPYWHGLMLVTLAAFAFVLVAGSFLSAIQLANAEDWVRHRFQGSEPNGARIEDLRRVVGDMSIAAGLAQPPALLVLKTESSNAFAIGTVRSKATIGVTRGMLDSLTDDELRAVVATLIARIVAGDIMFGTALAALMGPIKAIRESRKGAGGLAACCTDTGCGDPGCSGMDGCGDLDGCADLGSDSDGCVGAIGLVLFIAFVVAVTYVAVLSAAWIVTLWGRALNRVSYEKADAEGMLLLKDPAAMLSALRKAIKAPNLIADGDPSYDGIFFASTSGTPRIEKAERRRFERLAEVLGVEGGMAQLDAPE